MKFCGPHPVWRVVQILMLNPDYCLRSPLLWSSHCPRLQSTQFTDLGFRTSVSWQYENRKRPLHVLSVKLCTQTQQTWRCQSHQESPHAENSIIIWQWTSTKHPPPLSACHMCTSMPTIVLCDIFMSQYLMYSCLKGKMMTLLQYIQMRCFKEGCAAIHPNEVF